MSTIMIKFPKDRVQELKGMVSEGLHIFGRVMSEVEQMCRESDSYGDRMPYMGERYGDRYGDRMPYDDEPYMGERNYHRSSSTGRFMR